jgi:hypothetical protein
MTSAKQAVPLFLSSSRDESGDSDETSFTVRLQPPLRISDKATKVSAYIDSATVPYSFPNLTSSTAKVVVRMPLGAGYGNSGEVTLTLPTGVYDLTEIAEQLNSAVNTYLHTNGYPILTGDWKYYDFSTNTVNSCLQGCTRLGERCASRAACQSCAQLTRLSRYASTWRRPLRTSGL